MTYKNLTTERGGFTLDNTSGYSQEQIDALNAELDSRLEGVERFSEEYDAICQRFADEVAAR